MLRPLLLCLGLAACAASPPVTMGTSTAPGFGDSDPADFGRRGPDRFAVHGIDVARYQPRIDWPTARRDGVSFAWIKATEGGDRVDQAFAANWAGAETAGVPRGAYHFYYFCTDPETQAANFIRTVPRETGSLPPMVDLEWNPFSPTCVYRPPVAEILDVVDRFMDILERHYGQRPVIYTGVEFWRDRDIRSLEGELWLRSVAAPVEEAFPGTRPTFWQYSGTGIVEGIPGNTDTNAFTGTPAAWRDWLARRRL